MKIFSVRTYDGLLVPVKGKLVENPFGWKVFIHKNLENTAYSISDYRTGLALLPLNLAESDYKMKELIEKWIAAVERNGNAQESYEKNVQYYVKKYGYANQE